MIGLCAGVVWVGYTLAWWGWETLQGCHVGFADLVVPGRYHGCNPSSPSSSSAGPDSKLMPAPGAGPGGTQGGAGGASPTSPPSSEGYASRVPRPGVQLNQPTAPPPGWVNPFAYTAPDSSPAPPP